MTSSGDYNPIIKEQLADGIVEPTPNTVEGWEFYILQRVVCETAVKGPS